MDKFISFGESSKKVLDDAVTLFKTEDEGFREQLIDAGKILGINPQLSKASIALNNSINFFLRDCHKNQIYFPINIIIASDICSYLINLYYTGLSDSVDDLNDIISEYLSRNKINQFIHSKMYYKDLCEAFRTQIVVYNEVAGKMYDFDINKYGESLVRYVISSEGVDKIRVIDSHIAYHTKMNNVEVIEALNKIK